VNGRPVVITGIGTAIPGVTWPADLVEAEFLRLDGVVDPAAGLSGRGVRFADRATKLALCAARDTLVAAGLIGEDGLRVAGRSVGVAVSSNYGNADTICRTVDTIATETYLGTSPMLLPATASNVIAAAVAIRAQLRGVNLTLCNGPTSGLDAVHCARVLVASGRIDRMLVIGVEPANKYVHHLVEQGGDHVRMFDGAAALVVEAASAARERDVHALAEVGPYARASSHAKAVLTVRAADPGPVGLWCAGEGSHRVHDAGRTRDLTALLGRCSGALGVLQCVAGAAWLAGGGGSAVLATAGEGMPDDDASAALVLSTAGDR